MQVLFWSVLAVGLILLVPAVLVWSAIDYVRGRGSERRGGGTFSAGIGAAMQELDRVMARPSVEHQIETEHPTRRRDDDAGGA
jgi:hypothetical protein